MTYRSGDVLRLAPGLDNQAGFKSLHKIHPELFKYRLFGAADTTFVAQEAVVLGGDLRLYADGRGRGSVTLPHCSQEALDAILDWVDFNGLDAEVTARHWNGRRFADYSAVLQYVPPADLQANFCEVFDPVFTYIMMSEIVDGP